MIQLASQVSISTGTIEVSWQVHPFHFTTDMTSGFLITNIKGYEFPANYFGQILHLAETADGFEYMEEDIRAGRPDKDSQAVLDAIKHATVAARDEASLE